MEGTKSNQGSVSEVPGPWRPAQKGPHNLPCGRQKAGILTPAPVLHQLRIVLGGPDSARFSSVPEFSAEWLLQSGEVPDEMGSNVPAVGCSQGSWNHSCDRNQRRRPRGCDSEHLKPWPHQITQLQTQSRPNNSQAQAWHGYICFASGERPSLPQHAHQREAPPPPMMSALGQ